MVNARQPDLEKGNIQRIPWPACYSKMPLYANGWLIGVMLENDPVFGGYMSGWFEVTDIIETQILGRFYWEFAMSSAGIIFPKPLQNMSTANPYYVRQDDDRSHEGIIQPVIISELGVW